MNSTIIVSWRRLTCGLWRIPAGDIYRAYSASHLPQVKTFDHKGRKFTCMSIAGRAFQHEATAYELIPATAYTGPEPKERGYEGKPVTWQKQSFRLGPRVQLQSSDPTVDEWRGLLRVLYADGGMFAARKTYAELLHEWAGHDHTTPNEPAAIQHELAAADLPTTQDEMRVRLSSRDPFTAPASNTQLQLSL